jgi:putative peptidoglycan lipid II flippase
LREGSRVLSQRLDGAAVGAEFAINQTGYHLLVKRSDTTLFLSGLSVTFLTGASQFVAFWTQLVAARFFGAGAEMDALIAASTIPAFVTGVLLASLGLVFIPAFVRADLASSEEAWTVASSILNLLSLCLVIAGVVGIVFRGPLTHLAFPGLRPTVAEMTVSLTLLTWPAAVVSGIATLLCGIHQANRRFGIQAASPAIGSLVTVVLIYGLSSWGIAGLAWAKLLGTVVQVGILVPLIWGEHKYRFVLRITDPRIQQVLKTFAPVLVGGIFLRCTPVVDRFVASGLDAGSISHLDYALKLVAFNMLILSAGVGTVLFPDLATDAATDNNALQRTLNWSSHHLAFDGACLCPGPYHLQAVGHPSACSRRVQGE